MEPTIKPDENRPYKSKQTEIEELRARVAELERAFDDQTRELEIACEVMTPDQLTEFRHRAYPTLHPRPVTLISSNPESWLGA